MTMHKEEILTWQDGQPVSKAYGDVYFSRASGIEETRYVYLQHNRLPERWRALDRNLFTIGETGFGTGLNFLCAWQLWRECAPADARLHFVSAEKYPLHPEELREALALWPELASLSQALLDQYEILSPGWRRFQFENGRITLTLLIGDARDTLPLLNAKVDAWFLDGFSPSVNPELWQPPLFQQVARLSAPGATFATFTSAGEVRRGLQAAGFDVHRVPGHGHKRHMSCGQRTALPSAPKPIWQPPATSRRAVVIGGGLAGTATAHSLATRGWQVTLIERHAHLAQEASGNPQGVLYPRLSGHDIPLSRVAQDGFLHTLSLLHTHLERGVDWDACGLLQQAFNAREAKRCAEVMARGLPASLVTEVDAAEASSLAGIAMPHGGLWFPSGGWVHPPALCRALASHPNIQSLTSSEALTLERTDDGWQVRGATTCLAEAGIVVLAGANDTKHFPLSAHLPLEPVRGQITQLPATAASTQLKAVICTEGYISPARHGQHCAGASFSPNERDLTLRIPDHEANLAMLKHLSPALYAALGSESVARLQGRTALRCATPDYLPMAGPLLDPARTMALYEPGSRLGAEHLPWQTGLFVNTGHGSKGLLTAPLCAELIAAQLNHEPLPVDTGLAKTLDPNRFLLRERGLKRLIGAAVV